MQNKESRSHCFWCRSGNICTIISGSEYYILTLLAITTVIHLFSLNIYLPGWLSFTSVTIHTADDFEIITWAPACQKNIRTVFPTIYKMPELCLKLLTPKTSSPKLSVLSSLTLICQSPACQTRILTLPLTPPPFTIPTGTQVLSSVSWNECLLSTRYHCFRLGPYHSRTVSDCSPTSRHTPLPSPFYQCDRVLCLKNKPDHTLFLP